jgi:hypothetical protein
MVLKFFCVMADEVPYLLPLEFNLRCRHAGRVLRLRGNMRNSGADKRSLSERLRMTTDELQTLETMVLSGDCAPRVLAEFRSAVDSIRQTAWAVQQWNELQQRNRDPYTVLGILSAERVRRATQITKDLTMDLESLELGLETEGLEDLFQAIRRLYERLDPLFRKTLV